MIDVTFDESIDIILPRLHVSIHDFIEMRAPKDSGTEIYELLLKYKCCHDSGRSKHLDSKDTEDLAKISLKIM